MGCVTTDKTNRRKATCLFCNCEFLKNSINEQRSYCSKACSNSGTKRNRISLKCNWCQKEFTKHPGDLGKHNNFCSVECGEAFKRGNNEKFITKYCLRCGKEYTRLYRQHRDYCSKKCSSPYQPGKEHSRYGMPGSTTGMKPWTFGLTKETDARIAAIAKKVSETHKEQFASGVRSNRKEHNPNWGKTVSNRTPEQLENYSKGAIKRIQANPDIGSNKYTLRGKYISEKTGKTMGYRSSYELRLMKCFDADNEVLDYVYEGFSIKLGTGKRYLPDFVINYKDGSKKMIEAKGWIKDPAVFELKCKTATSYCNSNNILYEVWKLPEIKAYEQRLGIELDV